MRLTTGELESFGVTELDAEQCRTTDGGVWPIFVAGVIAGWNFMDKYIEARKHPC